jgi:hypothetical protein
MELALNLVWVCLAVSGFALLGSNYARASEHSVRQANNQQKIMAMSCALIILFFVVSMTDDLHDQEIFVEDSKSLRAMASTGSLPHSSPQAATCVFVVLSAFACSSYLPALRRLVERSNALSATALHAEPPCGRAPPVELA